MPTLGIETIQSEKFSCKRENRASECQGFGIYFHF